MVSGAKVIQEYTDDQVANGWLRISTNGGSSWTAWAQVWNSSTLQSVPQSEAEAGTSTISRAWTAQRVRQNVAAYASQLGHQHAISNITGLQAALDAKAPLASPALTGVPTAPTATAGTSSTQIATTAFVKAALDALIASAPGTLDTLNEIAAALGDDPNFAATMTAQLAGKADLGHGHAISDIAGLQDALDARMSKVGGTFTGDVSVRSAEAAGLVALVSGDATRTGRIEFKTADDVRRGYIGWKHGTSNSLVVQADNGWSWQIGGQASFELRPTFNGHVPWDEGNFVPSDYLPKTGGRIIGSVSISKAAGADRALSFETAGVLRWQLKANSSAEGGSGAGSDLVLGRYDDAGVWVGDAFAISRATGDVVFSGVSSVASLKVTGAAGVEGGEIRLAKPVLDTALTHDITLDIQGSHLRIFESGGATRGVKVDLSAAPASAGGNLWHSGNLDITDYFTKAEADARLLQPRNRLINACFRINQRGAAYSDNGFFVDRWISINSGGTGVLRSAQVSAPTPAGSPMRGRATVQTAQVSLTPDAYYFVGQAVEGFNIHDARLGEAGAKSLLARIGVRSSVAGTFGFSICNEDGSRTWVGAFTIAAEEVNTDVVRTFVIPGSIVGTWKKTEGVGLYFRVCVGAGADWHGIAGWQSANKMTVSTQTNLLATAGATFDVFDAGLYVDTAEAVALSRYELASYQEELRLCRRFFRFAPINLRFSSPGNGAILGGSITLDPPMRVAPSTGAPQGYPGATSTTGSGVTAFSVMSRGQDFIDYQWVSTVTGDSYVTGYAIALNAEF
ncbi:MAG: hypothetical protein DI537_13670 [Stutzerimonas stutzeri]|nr:MAG: hypothetical protein DI537_13670 [Stutzerimonas stutzeri]